MKQKEININDLTPEQKAALLKELEQSQKADAEKVRNERLKYKELVNDTVKELFPTLQESSNALAVLKKKVFESFQTLVKMKSELYDREEDQTSHSFSTSEGEITIIIGYNMNDGWDDTVNTGVAKVNDYMQSLIHDQASKDLVDTVMKLLSKDSKGNLKASRVLQLKQLADKSGNKEFVDAIQIIQEAYRPTRSKEYIRCEYKDAKGVKQILPLSITDAMLTEAEVTK